MNRLPSLEEVAAVSSEEIPALLGQLEILKAALLARTLPSNGKASLPAPPEADRLLTPEETAERLGISRRWLYRHSDTLPFTRRLSRKALRFSEAGLRKWQATRPR